MNDENFYKTERSDKGNKPDSEKTYNAIPMPPKILVELNPSVLEGHTLDNRFLIIRDLSKSDSADKGGIGLIYLAEDLKLLGKKVVIKILQESASKNEDLARKFKHEKEALIRLDHHPNVVRLLDSGTLSDGNPYMVMEYIHGYSLRLVLTEKRELSFEFCAHVIESITNALFAAHSKNILHRDIKPENIMLTPQEESFEHVRLIDFGIARVENSKLAPATQIERGIGTVLYIAPEQLAGQIEQSPAVDIYSCAIVAYEMLTGQLPFEPHTTVEMFLLQEKGVKKLPCDICPDIPEATQRLLLQALSFDPKARPKDIRLFGRNLADSLRHVGDTQLKNHKQIGHPLQTPRDKTTESRSENKDRLTNPDSSVENGTEKNLLNQSIVTEVRRPTGKTIENEPSPQNTAHALTGAPPDQSKKFFLYGFSAVLILLTAVSLLAGFGWWYIAGTSADKTLANANTAANSVTEVQPALHLHQISYYLNVQKMRDGKPFEEPFRATGREIFENGYKFKMFFNSTSDGYLYLFNEGKNEKGETTYYILYPTSEQKDSEKISAASEIETGYQVFGGGKGTEIIWLVWTKEENADLQMIKQSALGGTGGALQEADASSRLSAFLQQYDESQIETVKDSVNKLTTVGGKNNTIIHRFTLEHQ